MQSKTPMVLVLQDGEEIHGMIEWYDKYCLKVNRTGASNLLIYKPSIKYLYKESEAGAAEVEEPRATSPELRAPSYSGELRAPSSATSSSRAIISRSVILSGVRRQPNEVEGPL